MVSQIFYLGVYFYQHQLHFHTDSISPFHNMVLSQDAVVSFSIFAVRLLKMRLVVLRYGLLHNSSGLEFSFQFSRELTLLLGGFTHLCFTLQMEIHSM